MFALGSGNEKVYSDENDDEDGADIRGVLSKGWRLDVVRIESERGIL